MVELPINANVCEIDGPHYPVHLDWVPRVGELIDLESLIASTSHPSHRYEVAQVVHRLYDISDHESQRRHFVTVFVSPTENRFFDRVPWVL